MKEPETVRELYFYIEGEFSTLSKEIKNIKRFSYWIAGIVSVGVASISAALLK